MEKTIFKSELNVMEVLWASGDMTAKEISLILTDTIGWNKATTYTIIKRLVEKGLIQRLGFDFTCHATITREDAVRIEFEVLAEKMFGGSSKKLIEALLFAQKIEPENLTAFLQSDASGESSDLSA